MQVAPEALRSNVNLIYTPGVVGRLEMTAQALIQFGAMAPHPAPNRHVIRLHAAPSEQRFDMAEREGVAKKPTHGTKNELRPFAAT